MKVNLKIIDNKVDGRILATTTEGSGRGIHVHKVPKSMIDICTTAEYKYDGIYFLVDTKNKKVYVGKAEKRTSGEGIVKRANERDASHKAVSEWDYLVFVVDVSGGVEPFFNGTTLGYMEFMFYQTIKESAKYTCTNKQAPHHRIPDDKETYDKLVESCKSIFYALGFDFLITKTKFDIDNVDDDYKFEMKHKGLVGKLAYDKNYNKYMLLKNSDISKTNVATCYKWIVDSRNSIKQYVKNGKLQKDIPFDNPSRAAGVVSGASVNGRDVWKNKNGKKLGDVIKGN